MAQRRLQIETYLQHVVQAVLPQLQQERDDKNLHLENLDSSVIQDDSGNESILVVNASFLPLTLTSSFPPFPPKTLSRLSTPQKEKVWLLRI